MPSRRDDCANGIPSHAPNTLLAPDPFRGGVSTGDRIPDDRRRSPPPSCDDPVSEELDPCTKAICANPEAAVIDLTPLPIVCALRAFALGGPLLAPESSRAGAVIVLVEALFTLMFGCDPPNAVLRDLKKLDSAGLDSGCFTIL